MAKTDFNDLHCSEGLEVVKAQLESALTNFESANDQQLPSSPVPSDEGPPPSRLTIQQILNRFALIAGKTAIWDFQERQVVKKPAMTELVSAPLYKEWINHENRRTVSPGDVASLQAKANTAERELLERYVYIYPTKEAWDCEIQESIPLEVLKVAAPAEYPEWLKSPRRKSIHRDKLVFDPTQTADPETHINRFTGLTLKRNPDHSRCFGIMQLLENICGHRPDVFEWVTRWLAYPLQHIGAKLDTALLVHSSQQGSGKSMLFADICCALYGRWSTVLGQHQLESQYTDWRSEKLFGVFEEVLSRDQKYSHMGTVKHMITGKTQRIEKKFLSGWEESNHMNSIFLSNEFQPFPLEPSDRRFLVVWPEQTLTEDIQWRASDEIKNGGLEAFYDFLMDYPLGDFNPHTQPIMTKEKERLINFGLPAHEFFYKEWAGGDLDIPFVSCVIEDLYAFYLNWCREGNEKPISRRKFTSMLSVMPELKRMQCRYNAGYEKEKARMFVVGVPPDEVSRPEWLGQCVTKFREKAGNNEGL